MRLWFALRNRIRWLAFYLRHRRQFEALPSTTVLGRHVAVLGSGLIRLGDRVTLCDDVVLEAAGGGRIVVADWCWLSKGVIISAHASVELGPYSMVGEYGSLRDFDHGMEMSGVPMMRQPFVAAPIHLGQDVWLGRGVCVLKGVTIGDGAVVGANAVVTRDMKPGDVAVGVPARVIRNRAVRGHP